MIIDKVRDFMRQCPYLNGDRRVNVDFLPDKVFEYTIDAVPTNTTVKTYADGGKVKQFTFVFASKEHYGPEALVNIENNGFYQKVADWIEDKSNRYELPKLSEGKESMFMEVLDSGYLFHADENRARYQMQIRLVYYQN